MHLLNILQYISVYNGKNMYLCTPNRVLSRIGLDIKAFAITMKMDDCTHHADKDSCVGLTSSALPEAKNKNLADSSDTGVSTHCINTEAKYLAKKSNEQQNWYALRTTYGREKKAYDYLVAKGVSAFYPTIKVMKEIRGQRKIVTESRLPNIFFAFGTEEEIKSYVYDNVNLPYLRFYYRHMHEGARITKSPLIVPQKQIEGLKIICESEADDILYVPEEVQKFKEGQMVRVIDGKFKGVTGRVARYQGQQRVAIIIDGGFTMATAYLPTAFLEYI